MQLMKGKAELRSGFRGLHLAWETIWKQHLAAFLLCLYKLNFLPKDSCQCLLFYSALCIFGHNNWKHSCAGTKPIQRRYTAVIITAPQQRAKVRQCSRKLLFICRTAQQKTTQTLISADTLAERNIHDCMNEQRKPGIKNRRTNDTCVNILVITTEQPHLNEKKTWGFHKIIPT